MNSDLLAAAVERIRRWTEPGGILVFVEEEFGVKPDPWQRDALLAFESKDKSKQRLSMQACAGPGKTAVLAWCGLWFLSTQGEVGNHPKGAAVSISKENLRDNLWAELGKWLAVSPYLSSQFTWTGNRIFSNDHPETWFLSARAWPKSANADEQGKTLSGLHSKFPFVLIDESGAIPTTVLRAAEQALSTCEFGKIAQGGNPISLEGMLYAAATQLAHQWHVIRITGDPTDPKAWVHSPRVGEGPREWAEEQIRTYGRDNPWVMGYILGKFPPASINALFSEEEIVAAMARVIEPADYEYMQKRLGVDVARFGDDRTVIFPRQGRACFKPVEMRNANTNEIAARVAMARAKWGAEQITVDDTGHWGHGVLDNLTTAGIPAIPIVYHSKAFDPRYRNRRVEMYMSLRDAMPGLALPNLPGLVGELTAITYSFIGGVFVLSEKDQIKAVLGRSPDLADALAQTFAMPDMPGALMESLTGGSRQKALKDEDPYPVAVHDPKAWETGGQAQRDFNPNEL